MLYFIITIVATKVHTFELAKSRTSGECVCSKPKWGVRGLKYKFYIILLNLTVISNY